MRRNTRVVRGRILAVLAVVLVLVLGAVPTAVRPFVPEVLSGLGGASATAAAPLDLEALRGRVGSVVDRLDAAALAELEAGRTDVAAPQDLPAGLEPAGEGCYDLYVLGVRGSGESATEYGGLGITVSSAVATMADEWEGRHVGVEALDYPASSVSQLLTDPQGYLRSIRTGAERAVDVLAERRARCAGETVVVVGFSQGAMVAHRALTMLAETDRPVLGGVSSAVLISDGYRLPGGVSHTAGTADAGQGLGQLLDAGVAPLPRELEGRLFDVCDAGDPVCDPASTDRGGIDTHTAYKLGHAATREAATLAARVAVGA